MGGWLGLVEASEIFRVKQHPRSHQNSIPGHTTRAPPVGFELATNGIQFRVYVIANLDKTPLKSEESLQFFGVLPELCHKALIENCY